MRRRYYIIGFFLFAVLVLSFNFNFVNGFDEDDDKVNDEFEKLNMRIIETDIFANEIQIDSIRQTDNNKDLIRVNISCDENGVRINFNYRSNLEALPEFEFSIVFQEIIEFIDIEENGIYDPEVDQKIQNFSINDFQPIENTTSPISNKSSLYYFKISTINNTFTTHIYVAEEFTVVNDTLITPTQLKIDVEILNFSYINSSSNLALYTKLESETNYEHKEITEDETMGYAENEQGVISSHEGRTGFLTWKRFATIDEITQEIPISEIMLDDHNENEQKIYLNYQHGDHIYHDPKVGIEGLLIPVPEPFSPTEIIIWGLIIGAVSVSIVYSIYHFGKSDSPPKKVSKDREVYFKENFEEDDIVERYKETSPLQIFFEENSVEKLIQIRHLNITVVSEDFYEKLNRFQWDGNEKSEFIREMLALNPSERKLILDEMIKKSEFEQQIE
ncbi:MAG: hypothetical protein ACXAAH_07415 [Promethearchaeota archaeon]|jgi:hypothetical protein